MKPKIDYGLYLVTDRTLMNAVNLEQAVEQAVSGGCTLVQLREKEISTKEFYDMACKIRKVCSKYKIPLIINDRVDIALAVDADGVHLGSEDMPIETARKLIGKNKILGASARTLREAVLAESEGADYLGVGAMFPTDTKSDATLVAREELIKISQVCTVPIVVIGGINERTLPYFDEIAIDGLAVVSSVISADDIAKAARNLRRKFAERKVKDKPITFEGIECAVFDLDGTLFDSNDLWEQIDIEFLSKRGYEIPADYITKVSALNFREAAEYTKKLFGLKESARALIAEWREMAQYHYEHDVKLKPYAKRYLHTLKSKGIRLAVATSLPPALFVPALKNNGVYDLFDCLCSAENAARGKEHPDFFIDTIRQLKAEPQKCLFFEDVLSAMQAIKAAGAKVCGVYDYYSRPDLANILSAADCFIMKFNKAPLLKSK